jgi:hypothetical protein
MKMPAIRAILRDGGVMTTPAVRRRGPLRVDAPKAGREWEPQGASPPVRGEALVERTPVAGKYGRGMRPAGKSYTLKPMSKITK